MTPRPMARRFAGALIGLGLLAGPMACSSSHESGHHEEAGNFPVTRPLRKDTELITEYVAQIHAIQHIEMRALERGYLTEIHVDEGQQVREGAKMFQVMPLVYKAELQKAIAEAEYAQIEYENTQALRDKNVVSATELALSRARLDKANAERALAEAHLSLTDIRAPFDGIMGRLQVRKGSLLDEGDLLTTLADNSEMWVYFNVSEPEYLEYRKRVGTHDPFEVTLRMANGEVFAHPGDVKTIEADFNNETGNIAFRATFPNPDGLLRHGETGNVMVSTRLKDVLIIPQKATFDVLDRKFVFVVDEENVVHQREITVAHELPHLYVIDSGLGDEDRILLEGLRRVRDGHEIGVAYEEPEAVLSKLDVYAE